MARLGAVLRVAFWGAVLVAVALCLMPDRPRMTVGGETVAFRARETRSVFVGVGLLGWVLWRSWRRDRSNATAELPTQRPEPSTQRTAPPPRQPVEHRLDVHEQQIHDLTQRLDDWEESIALSPAPEAAS